MIANPSSVAIPSSVLPDNESPAASAGLTQPTFRQRLVACFTRLLPFYSGCGALSNHPWVQGLAGPSTQRVWAKIVGGKIIAPLADHVGRAAFFCGDLDPKVTWVCKQIVRPGDTVLDIGANIGVTTVGLASLVGKMGRVHSFEPNPELNVLLRQVIERNRLSQVTLHSMALGTEETEMQLRVPADNAGMGSLVRHGAPGDALYNVPVRRLSDVVTEQHLTKIRFIKIDVEGFEAEVFKGAEKVFSDIRPDAILFELNGEKSNLGEVPVVRLLADVGYEFLGVPRCLTFMKLERAAMDKPPVRGTNDYIAIRRGVVIPGIAAAVR